jgi:hypothetical protein
VPARLAADGLQEHCISVEIKELLLAAGEYVYADGFCSVDRRGEIRIFWQAREIAKKLLRKADEAEVGLPRA